ncbi:UNVERIFIED_ORG: putative membrane protein [Agrobacterium larrymoorei]|nr:putative membrane protein [Agrobacterium larrymoorei]
MSGNEARAYNDAATAQLGERVTNLGRRQSDLESEMRSGFKNVETTMSAIANEMRSSISTLSASIAERSRTQWPVIWTAAGVSFTILAALSAFVYGTLSKDQTRLDAAIMKNAEIIQASVTKLAETTQQNLISMSERMVTRQEMEYRQQRGAEDRVRMEAGIKEVRDAQVPRLEMERQWDIINRRLDGLEARR